MRRPTTNNKSDSKGNQKHTQTHTRTHKQLGKSTKTTATALPPQVHHQPTRVSRTTETHHEFNVPQELPRGGEQVGRRRRQAAIEGEPDEAVAGHGTRPAAGGDPLPDASLLLTQPARLRRGRR